MRSLITTLLIISGAFLYTFGQQDYDVKADSLSWGVMGPYGKRIPYYRIPGSQIQPIQFCGDIFNAGDSTLQNIQFSIAENSSGWTASATRDSLLAGSDDSLCVSDFLFPSFSGLVQFTSEVTTTSQELNTQNNYFDTLSVEYSGDFLAEYARDNVFTGIQGGISDTSFNFEVGNIFEIFYEDFPIIMSVVVHPSSSAGESIFGVIYKYDDQMDIFTVIAGTDSHNLTQAEIQSGQPVPLYVFGPLLYPGTYLATVVAEMSGPNKVVIGTSGFSPDSTSFIRTNSNPTFQSISQTPMVRLAFGYEGLEEKKNSINMDVFPNPAIDKTTISFELNNEAMVQLFLTDLTGKVVYTSNLKGVHGTQKVEINTSLLSEGIYLMNVEMDGSVFTQKLVVTK